MKIWIISDEQERGPYPRDEVLRLLSTGEVTEDTPTRINDSEEVQPLREALKRSAGLFSFDEIVAKEEENKATAAASTWAPPDFTPSRSRKTQIETEHPLASIRGHLAAVVALLLLCGGLAFNYYRTQELEDHVAQEENGNIQNAPGGDGARSSSAYTTERGTESSIRPGERSETIASLEASKSESSRPGSVQPNAAALMAQLPDSPGGAPNVDMVQSPKADEGVAMQAPASAPDMPASSPLDNKAVPEMTPKEPQMAVQRVIHHPSDGSLTEPELMGILEDRFASQRVKTYEEKENWAQKRKSTFEGSFELETPLQWNPKIKVRYRVPLNSQNLPAATADNIVMACLWYGAVAPPRMKTAEELVPDPKPEEKVRPQDLTKARAKALEKERQRVENNPDLHGHMKPFSDGLQFTTFSLEIVMKPNEMGNTREAYFHGGPEWVDVVRRAREEIIRRHHLKDTKKLFLHGVSMGGSFAARLGVAMGNDVAGVVVQIAPEMTLPVTRSNAAWYVGVTRGDGGQAKNEELAKRLRMLGTPCVHVISPPAYKQRGVGHFYHSVSPVAQRAALMFLKGVAERQDTHGENDPTRWPYVRDSEMPFIIRRNDREAAMQIPDGRREYMPTREFVRTIQSMPVPMQTVVLDSPDSSRMLCMVGVPPLGRPKGTIIISHKYQLMDLPQLLNNINFLAEQGYVVLTPRMRGNPSAALAMSLDFVSRNRALAGLPLSFISIASENEPLWKLLLSQRQLRPTAHVPIDFHPGDLLDSSKWPLGAKIEWPMLFLYDQKDFAKLDAAEMARQMASKLKDVQKFVDSMKQRNQVADVRFVPLGQKSEEQGAQKSIETALQFINASVTGKIRTQFK